MRILLLFGCEQRSLATVRKREQPSRLARELGRPICRATQRIELVEIPPKPLRGLSGRPDPLSAHFRLERVRDLGALEQTRRAQVTEQVLGARNGRRE